MTHDVVDVSQRSAIIATEKTPLVDEKLLANSCLLQDQTGIKPNRAAILITPLL